MRLEPCRFAAALVSATSIGLLAHPIPASHAQALPVGAEFQVNTYTTEDQDIAAVAALSGGGFVVVWKSGGLAPFGMPGPDGDYSAVQGQRYDAAGSPAGTEFQVNTYTTDDQYDPAVIGESGGGFVVVWGSDGSTGTDTYQSVQAQRFDASGAAVGTEFQVNTYTTGFQGFPSLAEESGGGFFVVWASNGSSGSDVNASIQGQRYDASGTALGTEFQINSYTTSTQTRPAVAVEQGGNVLVVWQSFGQDGDRDGVFGQLYDSAGSPAGTEFQVNTYTTLQQYVPAVAAQADGAFMVVWTSRGSSGSDTVDNSIQGQRFDASGVALGSEFQINTYTTYSQSQASVAAEPGGGFVVAYYSYGSSGSDSSNNSIQAQRYDASGTVLGAEFQVNTYTTAGQLQPAVATVSGGFVVAWQSFGSSGSDTYGLSVQGQRFSVPTTTTTTSTTSTTLPPGGCASAPLAGCLSGTRADFVIKDSSDNSRDKLLWRLKRGAPFDQADLGDPVTTTQYRLCIYDESGGVPSLVGSLAIDPSVAWENHDPKGFKYRDTGAAQDGVRRARLKTTGASGTTKAELQAKGVNLPLPAAFSAGEFFDQDAKVTVQLANDTTPACWTTEFTTSRKNTGDKFKARIP